MKNVPATLTANSLLVALARDLDDGRQVEEGGVVDRMSMPPPSADAFGDRGVDGVLLGHVHLDGKAAGPISAAVCRAARDDDVGDRDACALAHIGLARWRGRSRVRRR